MRRSSLLPVLFLCGLALPAEAARMVDTTADGPVPAARAMPLQETPAPRMAPQPAPGIPAPASVPASVPDLAPLPAGGGSWGTQPIAPDAGVPALAPVSGPAPGAASGSVPAQAPVPQPANAPAPVPAPATMATAPTSNGPTSNGPASSAPAPNVPAPLAPSMRTAPQAARPVGHSYDLFAQTLWRNTGVTISVNGMPLISHGTNLPLFGDKTDYLTPWLIDGVNVIAVDMMPRDAADSRGRVKLRASAGGNDLYEFTKSGSINVKSEDVPRWSWQDAPAWSGDFAEPLAAVHALADAIGRHQMDTVEATHAARYHDLARLVGEPTAADKQAARDRLKEASVKPLSDELKVIRYQQGRLVRVVDEEGLAPIVLKFQDGHTERTGEWWSKLGGRWQVVR